VDEDSGQTTSLLLKGFVDDIMAGSFAIRQSKTILAASVAAIALQRFDAFTRDDWYHENCGY